MAKGRLIGVVVLAIVVLVSWLLGWVLGLRLVWIRGAIRGVGLVVIAIRVLLVGRVAVVVIMGLVSLGILRLRVAILIVVVVVALVVGAKVGVVWGALLIVGVCWLSIVGLEMVFDCACEAFEAFRHIRGVMGARDTAMRIFIIFVTPKECFTIAELDSGVGVELEPSTEEASLSVLGELAKCSAFGDEVTIGRIRVKVAFELFGEGADLIVREFVRLFAGKTFEVVFGE